MTVVAPAPVPTCANAPKRRPQQLEKTFGTGHGAHESARFEYTAFQPAQVTPDEVIAIACDSRENLIAMGVIREPRMPSRPRPFPGQPGVA